MKYIKLFEDFGNSRFKVGQDVVALSNSKSDSNIKRVKGVVYNIKDVFFCNKCGVQYLNFGEVTSSKDGWCPLCNTPLGLQGKFWVINRHYAPLDEKTLEEMLEKAVDDEDYELAASLRDMIKSLKGKEKEEVITIEDWNKY